MDSIPSAQAAVPSKLRTKADKTSNIWRVISAPICRLLSRKPCTRNLSRKFLLVHETEVRFACGRRQKTERNGHDRACPDAAITHIYWLNQQPMRPTHRSRKALQ